MPQAEPPTPQPCQQLIRRQIVVVAQGVLDVERGTGRSVGIRRARGYHTHRPIIFGPLIRNAIDGDVADV